MNFFKIRSFFFLLSFEVMTFRYFFLKALKFRAKVSILEKIGFHRTSAFFLNLKRSKLNLYLFEKPLTSMKALLISKQTPIPFLIPPRKLIFTTPQKTLSFLFTQGFSIDFFITTNKQKKIKISWSSGSFTTSWKLQNEEEKKQKENDSLLMIGWESFTNEFSESIKHFSFSESLIFFPPFNL